MSSAWPAWLLPILLSSLITSLVGNGYLARRAARSQATVWRLRHNEARLAALAATDSLTGVANRRKFDETLDAEWRRAMRARTPIALLIIDIDYFKAYNDRYGHQLGDCCLHAVARAIDASARRPGDLVARYGGEEFAVVLPTTDLDGAREIAGRVHAAIQALERVHDDCPGGRVTVSIGIGVAIPARGRIEADLVSAADDGLYRAKRMGRNRIETGAITDADGKVLLFPTPARRTATRLGDPGGPRPATVGMET